MVNVRNDDLGRSGRRDEVPGPASGETRAERLARIRSMIDQGVYDTQERWDAALSRMFERVSSDE